MINNIINDFDIELIYNDHILETYLKIADNSSIQIKIFKFIFSLPSVNLQINQIY